ncbi:tyrosine-type recombinase/integrase [Evansella sp. AB-rgal1]|uniref:tyrosine-type recombinase/integrase n=1 Tax=Evansella sp. AB-rgal1 TaxID=3242696 RepID=UPI00359D4A51
MFSVNVEQIEINKYELPKELESFCSSREHLSNATKMRDRLFLKKFYNFYNDNKNIKYLSMEHFTLYDQSLKYKVENNELKPSSLKRDIERLKMLAKFLIKEGFLTFVYKPSTIQKKTKRKITLPPIVEHFLDDLSRQNYSQTKNYRKDIMYFFKSICIEFEEFKDIENLNVAKMKTLNKNHINFYHNFLGRRVSLEEISTSRAKNLLQSLRLFIKFLNKRKVNLTRYFIPEKFQVPNKRNNDYVPIQESIRLIDTIADYSKNPERDLTIALLIVDTGCRPIEIVNMKISDVLKTESTIYLRSKKSGQRKLKISKPVMDVLKVYLTLRCADSNPDHHLFLSKWNEAMTSKDITSIFYTANKRIYGKSKYSPKAFRHTYITNALENRNNFDQVSKTSGHKYWISTIYYLERSHERLKRNTLKHNPIKF